MKTDYDLIVIGAGSAGLTAVRFARSLGLSVALIERSRVGGDCTWTGCIPSKALLKAANVAQSMRAADKYGLPASIPEVDLLAVMERIRNVIRHIYNTESPEALAREGIDVIAGEARFVGPDSVAVEGSSFSARRFLICTGASPAVPAIPGLDKVEFHTYETIWDLEELPATLAVVGAGAVGCELAQAFARLGSGVTLIEAADRILPQEDAEVSKLISLQFAGEGIQVLAGAGAQGSCAAPDGKSGVRVELSEGHGVEAEALLVAVGRRPNTEGLGLEAAGVAAGPGGIIVDRYLRTTRKGIYAAGDATGGPQFTHYAGWQGFMAVRNAFLPLKTVAVRQDVPRATFTDPEAAQAGLTESEARGRFGGKALASKWPLNEVDRALTDGQTEGFVKAVHLAKGRILGATIVAPRAGEMIHQWMLAMDKGIKMGDLARSIHVYPTYSMASQQLALRAYSERLFSGQMGTLLRRLARRG